MNIAVITGASSGLGWEYTKAVFDARAELDEIWVIARREDRLKELQAKLGEKIIPVAFDITDTQAIDKYVTLLKEKNANVKRRRSFCFSLTLFSIKELLDALNHG